MQNRLQENKDKAEKLMSGLLVCSLDAKRDG
jgi:hypothetical protein